MQHPPTPRPRRAPAGPDPSAAQVYTVHVWRQAAAFRASVRAVGDDEAALFTAARQVASFLDRKCPPPATVPAQPPANPNRSTP